LTDLYDGGETKFGHGFWNVMRIADGIEALELNANAMGRPTVIYPTLIWDDQTVILVDAGFPGQINAIREAMNKTGVAFEKLNKVILTHQDIDHIGSLPDIIKELHGKVDVISHEIERPYIQGDKPLIKMDTQQMRKMAQSMPENSREMFEQILKNPPKARVDVTVTDGQELPLCGGISVIFTPGHTPGHIGLYHKRSKTLIAGDSLTAADGKLFGPRPQAAADIEMAIKSLEKYKKYGIDVVICYHGGVFKDHVNQRIEELIKGN
jgi:glyoxylase-like metal-dependent hydrolase (beta-lactamase superfamily II)